ncbi:MAG: WD40 domain-containing protein, partial [Planctomycetes bacterium]|nr:WD40 domain-containing protein [Planctomycetota bacterium]
QVRRVPVGPGGAGLISAIAVSPNGSWLAAAGQAPARGEATFRQSGTLMPPAAVTSEMRLDRGVIYLFSLQTGAARVLRGHTRAVQSLAFAPTADTSLLVSLAAEMEEDGVSRGELALWDADQAKRIADNGNVSQLGELANVGRPQLAVTGNGAESVEVRYVGGGKLYVWRPAQGDLREERVLKAPALRSFPCVTSDGVVVLVSWGVGGEEVLAFHAKSPAAAEWQDVSFQFKPQVAAAAPFRHAGRDYLCLASGVAQDQDVAYAMFVYDVAQRRLLNPQGRALWRMPIEEFTQPTIAASVEGGLVAVGPDSEDRVQVFAAADLAGGRFAPQIIPGAGPAWQGVRFAVNGNDQGLLLKDEEGRQHVFDAARGRLAPTTEGWSESSPSTAGWRWRVGAASIAEGDSLEVISPSGAATIRLGPWRTVSAAAVLPACDHVDFPIVAVAAFDRSLGRPVLALYHAQTGVQFRVYEGHNDRIRDVAFSSDGRLLASTAEDRTVCIWRLTDIDNIWGERGKLDNRDVVVGADLRVVAAAPAFPSEKLRPGDLVTGVAAPGARPVATSTSLALHEHFELQRPGTRLWLRRKRAASEAFVLVNVSQAVDVQHPLLTLVAMPQDQQWIGWNPHGPFESSDRQIERLVGWHFNTGREDPPALFADINEYREAYFRPGLVRMLLERAELPPAEVAEPEMYLRLEAGGAPLEANADGEYVVHANELEIKAVFHGPAAETVNGVVWRLDSDNREHGDFARHPRLDNLWTARIGLASMPRRPRSLEIRFTTDETPARRFARITPLQLRLPPPGITPEGVSPGERVVVKERDFVIKAAIARSRPDEPFTITLLHNDQPAPGVAVEDGAIQHTLSLKEGENRIELLAVNAAAPEAHREGETSRLAWSVVYSPPGQAPPPTVVLRQNERPLSPTESLIVDKPELRLTGDITAAPNEQLAAVQVYLNERLLAEPAVANVANFALDQAIPLQPGAQKIRVVAASGNSIAAETTLAVEYRPRLPDVRILRPAADHELVKGRDEPRVEVEVAATPADDAHPYRIELLLNGKVVAEAEPEDFSRKQTIVWAIELDQDQSDQEVRVRVSNVWSPALAATRSLRFLRPPRIARMEQPATPVRLEKPFLDVVMLVETPADLPLDAADARFLVNGAARQPTSLRPLETRGDLQTWRVELAGVPLDKDANRVELRVANRDGLGAPQVIRDIAIAAPKYQPPLVQLSATGASDRRRVKVEVKVASDDLPARVELRPAGSLTAFARRVVKESPARFEFEIELHAPITVLEAAAVNSAGEQTALAEIAFAPSPVRLAELRLVDESGAVDLFTPAPRSLAEGAPTLEGRVVFADAKDERLARPLHAHIFVNGFLQVVPLGPDDGEGGRRFLAPVILHYAEDNQIRVELPELPEARDGATPPAAVACAAPARVERLHVLLASVEEEDSDQLQDAAVQALAAKPDPPDAPFPNQFASRAFAKIFFYDPLLGGRLDPERLRFALLEIKDAIQLQQEVGGGPPNDVVMAYYRGREDYEDSRGRFSIRLGGGAGDGGGDSFAGDRLHDFLAEIPGATMLLLDVVRQRLDSAEEREAGLAWPSDSHTALLRARRSASPAAGTPGSLIDALTRVAAHADPLSLAAL